VVCTHGTHFNQLYKMIFLNTFLLLGAAGIAIPIIIHILNRKSATLTEWAAMQFLRNSMVTRRRRILLEETLLLVARCLLITLFAVALARPFIVPGSSVSWFIVLPMLLVSIMIFGATFALWRYPVWRRRLFTTAALLICIAVTFVILQEWFHFQIFGTKGRRDVALIIDVSDSMSLRPDGQSLFEDAVQEVEHILQRSDPSTAFSLIAGGWSPQAVVPSPIVDRETLLTALHSLKPGRGRMQGEDCLVTAALSLAHGNNPSKQIIIFSDGQRAAWAPGDTARWKVVRGMFDELPSRPPVLHRRIKRPETTRNGGISAIAFSRDLIGADRPVSIDVTLLNGGTEALTPDAVILTASDTVYRDAGIGRLAPGETRTLTFRHRFTAGQAHVVKAELAVQDDIDTDNTAYRVITPLDHISVLVIDGHPAPRFMDRASAYIALALAPDMTFHQRLLSGTSEQPATDSPYLILPTIVDAPAADTIADLQRYSLVILADAPRLPGRFAERLGRYIEQGGSLLTALGSRAEPNFYASWRVAGKPVLPAKIGPLHLTQASRQDRPVPSPAADTFTHPVLTAPGGPGEHLDLTSFAAFRELIPLQPLADVRVEGRLDTGDPMLVTHTVGRGEVTQLAFALDKQAGNLVEQRAFVPLLHQLVVHLAAIQDEGFNQLMVPGAGLYLPLATANRKAAALNNLMLSFRIGKTFHEHAALLQKTLNVNWRSGRPYRDVPKNYFSAVWTGLLRVPDDGIYTFEVDADDRMSLSLDGDMIIESKGVAEIKLEQNRDYRFMAVLDEEWGQAKASLKVTPPGGEAMLLPNAWCHPVLKASDLADQYPTVKITTSAGEPSLRVPLRTEGGRLSITPPANLEAGITKVDLPAPFAILMEGMLDKDGTLPYALWTDPQEIMLAVLDKADTKAMSEQVAWRETDSQEQLLNALAGQKFGQELWFPLATLAFLLAVAEIALTRWISRQRRVGAEAEVTFESRLKPAAGFSEQFDKLRTQRNE